MSDLTNQQRNLLVALASRYDERLAQILMRFGSSEPTITSDHDVAVWESFSAKIADLVSRDHPGDDGTDAEQNADAELAVVLVSRLMSRYSKNRGKG